MIIINCLGYLVKGLHILIRFMFRIDPKCLFMVKFFSRIFTLLCLLILSIPYNSNVLFAQNGLNFDGIDDYVTASPVAISGTMNRTVEAWIRTNIVGTQRVIVDIGQMPLGQRFTLNVLNGLLRIEIGGGGINSSSIVADGNWHHVAVTFDNGASTKYNLYIDGMPAGSGNIAQAINTASGANLLIGTRNDMVNRFQGDIDEVRVWSYARTQSQILAAKDSSFCGTQNGLLAYYKLNQGQAAGNNSGLTNALDFSGNSNNGTLMGFSLTGAASNWVIGSNVLPPVNAYTSVTASACGTYTSPSGNYVWTASGVYQDTIPDSSGCLTAVNVNLSILNPSSYSFSDGGCQSYTSPSGNYTWTTSGTYQDTLVGAASNGCDSILTIQVSIYTPTSGIANFTVCDSMMSPSGNEVWTMTGQYADTLLNVHGCDSFMTVFLTVHHSDSSLIYVDGCDSIYWSETGQYYNTTGIYYAHLLTTKGCDSVIVMDLAISTTPVVTVTQSGITLSATTTSFGNYVWVDCNNGFQPIPGAVQSTFTPMISGNYACTSSNGFCFATSPCFNVTIVGLEENLLNSFLVKPNPSNGNFAIKIPDYNGLAFQLEIVDLYGKLLYQNQYEQAELQLDLTNLSEGSYFCRIKQEDRIYFKKLIIVK